MKGDDGLQDEMRYLRPQPDFRSDPLALDEGTAERMLGGGLDPADAPPAYIRAAMLLEAIAAPPSSDELADEAAAVAALVAVARSSPHPAARRRPTVLTKLLSAKIAAAAAAAALSVGGVAAAATGNLPDPAQRVAHQMVDSVPAPDDHADAAQDASKADHSPTGPDASGAAKAGLCRAWQAGQGGEHGSKNDSTAFKALATAAGGSDKIADYCKDATATNQGQGDAASNGAPPSTVPEQAQSHDADHAGSGQSHAPTSVETGDGHSQGGTPPSTTPDPHN